MIYRILLDDIRREIEDILILDKLERTKTGEQIKYLTEKKHYRKGKTREEVYKWAKVRYEILMEKDSKDRVVVYPERDFVLVRNWLKFLYYGVTEKFPDGCYDYKEETLRFYLKELLKRNRSDIEAYDDLPKDKIVITMEDIKEQYKLWIDGKVTRTQIRYWVDRRNKSNSDIEYYPIEKEDLLEKWTDIFLKFDLEKEGSYFYSDKNLKNMYRELCEDVEKAKKEFEEKIKEETICGGGTEKNHKKINYKSDENGKFIGTN